MVKKFAFPDTERFKRQNFPEAIYCPNKTINQIISITKEFYKTNSPVILTHADDKIYKNIVKIFKKAKYHKTCKMITLSKTKIKIFNKKSYVCVITAGTSDIPVAEESAITLEFLGNRVERIYDVGVSGVHRLFKYTNKIINASCVIVVAGMEGALPSIVGGLIKSVVIGVPTSVGYGTNFNGLTSLFTMLNSCAANVCAVNVNDGFGAGIIAHLINNRFCENTDS